MLAWYTDPAQWTGSDAIGVRLWEHLSLSVASLAAGMAIALPIGLYIGHTGRFARVAVAVSNIGRAVPSLGWLGIAYPIGTALFHRGGIGFLPAFIGMVALAIPPIVTNTYAGLRSVDPELREAARGMGLRELQLLFRVEVPVSLTVILAGIRASAVVGRRHRSAGRAGRRRNAWVVHHPGAGAERRGARLRRRRDGRAARDVDRAGLRLAPAADHFAGPGGSSGTRLGRAVAGPRGAGDAGLNPTPV